MVQELFTTKQPHTSPLDGFGLVALLKPKRCQLALSCKIGMFLVNVGEMPWMSSLESLLVSFSSLPPVCVGLHVVVVNCCPGQWMDVPLEATPLSAIFICFYVQDVRMILDVRHQ